jgi:hypothetical protein
MVEDHQKDVAELKKQPPAAADQRSNWRRRRFQLSKSILGLAASLKSDKKVGSDNSAGVTPGPKSTGGSQPVTPMPERKQ